jgi:hypothetical protein
VNRRIKKTKLYKKKKHIDETAKEAPIPLHRMKPKRVYQRPGNIETVPFAGKGKGFLGYPAEFTPKEPPARHFQKKNKNQHYDDGPLTCPNGDILSKTVIPEMRLNEMKNDEDKVD